MQSNARIFQINTSRGGVPKLATAVADVTTLGIAGDAHHDRRHHGGPDRALCLYSVEQIMALQEEGHPIFPGSAGENIVTIGLDLFSLEPGARLTVGDDVEIEIASYTSPCKTIAASFIDGNFSRISQKVHPGWSRLYARVLREGSIRPGDPITLH
jgi:MOSC domain-containing protein YiiM